MLTAVLSYDHPSAVVEAFDTTDKTSGAPMRWKLTVGYNEIAQVAGLPGKQFTKTTADFEQRLARDPAGILHGDSRCRPRCRRSRRGGRRSGPEVADAHCQ
ncbi:hypothetical protein OG563_05840 [Nocardia vinacea]|uniref:Uncharacterized protein n=1 Tax=Nocardia vinacea TaxID=96468 RepID=A0ABZ1Z0X1_9NOCA|nr:hypothetical protein [Nocardia vinacea]